MKKRLIGTLLMGALFVSSTSVFVSCKDYDDDINNIVATKADKTALEEAKKALQDEINGLKTQLETVNGQITTLTNTKADKTEVEAVWASLNPLIQKAAALETRIGEAEAAINSINALLGGNLEGDLAGKTYKQALEDTWAKAKAASDAAGDALTQIEALKSALNDPTTGLKAVVADLQTQVEALNAYMAKVDAIQADYLKDADKKELENKITALETALNTKITDLQTTLTNAIADAKTDAINTATANANAYTDQKLVEVGVTIENLTKDMEGLSKKVDDTAALVNILNVYVRQALRGLVFNMKSYYQGVEATDLTVLWYRKYTLEATNADDVENWGYANGAAGTNSIATDWTDDAHNYAKDVTAEDKAAEAKAKKAAQAAANYNEHKHVQGDINKSHRYAYAEPESSRVLSFRAKYFMNPSSAVVTSKEEDPRAVIAISADKAFHSSVANDGGNIVKDNEFNGDFANDEAKATEIKENGALAGIKAVNWKTEDGMLIVDYDCTDPKCIRNIADEGLITIFATQVQVGNDTTVTSDFAAVYKEDVKDIRIAHTLNPDAMLHNHAYRKSFTGELNTHCGYCSIDLHDGLHLMQTVGEAAGKDIDEKHKITEGGFAPQDEVGYTDSLNLNKLVEIHYTTYDANGESTGHKVMSDDVIEAAGLHFNFVLTGLYYGDNKTSESAHAAIKLLTAADGVADSAFYLRPQMPTLDGKAAKWNEGDGKVGKQDRQTIGRTPIVRVELLDKDNNVVDYGYIRIKVVEDPQDEPGPTVDYLAYNTDPMKVYANFCGDLGGKGLSFTQTWYQMEWDVHHTFGITQKEFETYYEPTTTQPGNAGTEFQQYFWNPGYDKSKTGATLEKVDVDLNPAHVKLGTITYLINDEDYETSVINWEVTQNELYDYQKNLNGKTPNVVRVIRFEKKDGAKLPSSTPQFIYISLVPESYEYTPEPEVTATIDWTGRKNANYWYAKDQNVERSGFTEIHANVFGVEDAKEAQAETFKQTIQATFVGNKIADINDAKDLAAFIKVTNAPEDTYTNLHLALKFILGANKSFIGKYQGKDTVFVAKLVDNDRTLRVFLDKDKDGEQDIDEPEEDVAKLIYKNANDSLNVVDVEYQHTDFAEALLNYKAHNELADDVLTAYVAVTARYKNCPIPVTGDPINVRFLRPINVDNNEKTVEDASVNEKQIIYLRDLVKLSDWREQAFKTNYWYYYNIKSIEIVGLDDQMTFDQNEAILTNMNQAVDSKPATPLKNVSKLVEFKYFKTAPGENCQWPKAAPLGLIPELTPNAIPGEADYGWIEYTNLGSTVQKFKVTVPIKVVYQWGGVVAPATGDGAIFTTVDINVLKTHENARLQK